MMRFGKWLALSLLIVCFLLAAGLFALQRWIGTDDFRHRVEVQVSAALGKPVLIGELVVDLFPVPAVALNTVEVRTRPVMQVARLEVRPELAGLLSGRLELATLLIRRADVAQAAVDELVRDFPKAGKKESAGGDPDRPAGQGPPVLLPRRLVLDAVTWRTAAGAATTVNVDALLDRGGLPDALDLTVLAGRFQGAKARLKRVGPAWEVDVGVAGGHIKGKIERLERPKPADARLAFQGQLETRGVELDILLGKPAAGATTPVAGSSPMRGKLEATTRLSVEAAEPGGLVAGLQTHSQFTVRDAVVHGIDLARAVKTIGMNRGGETRLDTLTGQVDTRGRAIWLRNLAASSGALSANGNVAIAPDRKLSGRVNVNLAAKVVGSAVGVPLEVGGNLDAPQVTLTRSALVGAAIGTLVMPGVGTGAGASLGDKVGEKLKGLFGK